MFMPGAVSLAPGVEVVFDQTLNEWDGFRDQGQYRITAAIPLTPDKQFISRTAPRINVAFNVVVGPRNPDQVKETCEQLAAKATARNALAAVEASHALRYATDAACVPALARALAQFSMIVKLEALRGLAGVGTPDAAAAVAGEWDHLDDSEKASAFRWFGFSGSEALLRTALAARRGGIK